jgi:hypothetical protein
VTVDDWTKLTWSHEEFDTNNDFSSSRFKPSIAGKYLVILSVGCANTNPNGCNATIYKNGINGTAVAG